MYISKAFLLLVNRIMLIIKKETTLSQSQCAYQWQLREPEIPSVSFLSPPSDDFNQQFRSTVFHVQKLQPDVSEHTSPQSSQLEVATWNRSFLLKSTPYSGQAYCSADIEDATRNIARNRIFILLILIMYLYEYCMELF